MRTLRAAGFVLLAVAIAVMVALFRPVGADDLVVAPMPRAEALDRCEAAIQEEMSAIASLLTAGVPGASIAQWVAVYSAANGVPDDYRDSMIKLILAMEANDGISTARDEAVSVCAAWLAPGVTL